MSSHLLVRYRHLGSQVHCRVFVGGADGGEGVLCAQFAMRAEDWLESRDGLLSAAPDLDGVVRVVIKHEDEP
jgi:hypothetical protein